MVQDKTEIKNRLCLVIPSLQAGGMERVMSELAGYFDLNKDLDIHLVLYGINRDVFYSIPDSIILHKPNFRFNNSFRLLYTIKTLLFLRRSIKKINPESVLSFGEIWNSFVLISLVWLNYPIFISDRCQPDKSIGKLHDLLRKKLYPRSRGIIVQTLKAKGIYQAYFNHNNIKVIGNPIRRIPDDGRIDKENIVLSVGRLIETKHHDRLIELFLKIPMPEWKLVIVGYDHLKQNNSEKLKKIIVENGAEDRIILAGKQSDVDSYYRRSKIFTFTSSSEGFPNVIGEAMSAGLPVIAFDCVAGPSEMIIDGENGFLVPLFDYLLFRNKLEQLMESKELQIRLGEMGRVSIRRFDINFIGKKTLDFILPQP